MSKVIKMFYELKDANSGELLESNIGGQEIAFVSGWNHLCVVTDTDGKDQNDAGAHHGASCVSRGCARSTRNL